MKGRNRNRRMAGWLMALVMMLGTIGMAGCGQPENTGNSPEGTGTGVGSEDSSTSEAVGAQAEETVEKEKVMGRYLETSDDSLKDVMGSGSRIAEMEDGSLVLISRQYGKWVSTDNGITWEREKLAWFENLIADGAWIMNVAVGKDGSVAVIYGGRTSSGEDAGNVENAEDAEAETAEEVSDSKEEDGKEEDKGNGTAKETRFHPRYGIASPDGAYRELEIPYTGFDYVNLFAFAEDGRLFGSAMGGKVYEIDKETGTLEEIAEMPGTPYSMVEKDNRLVLVHGSGVAVVDLAGGETVEDKVLDEFLHARFGDFLDASTEGVVPFLVMPGEEGILYFAFDGGIYRHVIGGTVIEQVVDGSLSSLNDPSYGISDGILLENDEFMIVFSVGEVIRYTYDPDTPAEPDIQLRAYSLKECSQLKTIITKYQSEHPEVYIRYEIGMDGNSAVTREDALKKLNTEIAAGKGPDLFLLDDMPIDSYTEKGVLMDLSPYLADKTEDLYFTNVLGALQTKDGIYAVPSQFQLALMVGKKEDLVKMTDLESLADTVEAMREARPEGRIWGVRSGEEALRFLLPVCAPCWKGEDGKIDKEALTEFYTLAGRIWEAEDAGLTEDMRKEYAQWLEDMKYSGIDANTMMKYVIPVSARMSYYLNGSILFSAGVLHDSTGFDMIISTFKAEGEGKSGFAVYNGQAEGVFLPGNLMGINAVSKHQDIAAELMEKMLEDDGWIGIPVNKEQFRGNFRANAKADGSAYASIGGSNADGTESYSLDLYAASEEEVEALIGLAAGCKTPYIQDTVLENAVCEVGIKVLRGEISASAGAEEVIQKTAIYMAE